MHATFRRMWTSWVALAEERLFKISVLEIGSANDDAAESCVAKSVRLLRFMGVSTSTSGRSRLQNTRGGGG